MQALIEHAVVIELCCRCQPFLLIVEKPGFHTVHLQPGISCRASNSAFYDFTFYRRLYLSFLFVLLFYSILFLIVSYLFCAIL